MILKKIKHRFLLYVSRPLLKVPLLNWLIMTSLSCLLIKLSFHYHKLYTKSSIIASCCTNVVLFAISDTLAQSIASFRGLGQNFALPEFHDGVNTQRQRSNSVSSVFVDYGQENIGLHNLETESVGKSSSANRYTQHHVIFDFRRLLGFTLWGFFMAFIQVAWYMFLNSMYLELPVFVTVCARVLTDQLCFSPVSLYSFFAYSTIVLESGTRADLYEKVKNIYLSTLVANYLVWVPVQFMNFLIVPKNLQVPFSSSVGVLWNCFLSLRNAANSSKS